VKPIEEPVRWLDPRSEAPDRLRRVLAEGRDALGPTPEQMASLGASMAGATAAATGSGAGAGAAKAASIAATHAGQGLTKAAAVKLVAILAIGGAGGGIGWAVVHSSGPSPAPQELHASSGPGPVATTASVPPVAPPREDTTRAPAASGPAESIPVTNAPAPSAPAASEQAAREQATTTATTTGAPPRAEPTGALAGPAPAPTEAPPLEAPSPAAAPPVAESELALLDRARSRLPADPSDALRALDEHRARYPHGTFVQEREVLAIEALVQLGRRPEAEARAAAFAAQFPGSAHRRRIAVLLGGDGG
jgi:hypothetical protein